MAVFPGDELRFSPEAREHLGHFVSELIDDLEAQQSVYMERLRVWRRWYEARPISEQRAEPFEGASNLIIPYIRWQSDAVSARLINTIFAREEKVWVARSTNEAFRKQYATSIAEFMNWGANGNEYDLLTPCSSWISGIPPYGGEVLFLSWMVREKFLFTPGRGGRPKPQRVTLGRGPYIEHIPRTQMLWQVDRPIQESPIVVRQSFLSWGEVLSRIGPAGWNEEDVEACKGYTSGMSQSAQTRQQRLADRGLGGEDPYDPYDYREVWIDWPLLNQSGFDEIVRLDDTEDGVQSVPLVVTLHRETKRVVRVIAKPYFMPGQPFYHATYRPGDDPTAPEGLCRILEHLQRGITTMMNQAIDATTIANSIVGVTTNPQLASMRLSPNRFLKVANMNEITFPVLTKHVTPDLALINFLVAVGERLTGMSDPSLGRETRYGGHPSPAASTMAMLQESREPLRVTGRMIRREMSRLGVDIATLYQQHEVDADKIRRAIGDEDGAKVTEWMFPGDQPLHGNLELDLRAISDVSNPEAEFQRAMIVDQLSSNYFSRILQALTVAGNPQAPPVVKGAAMRSIEAMTTSFTRVLEAAEVDEIEEFLFRINQGGQPGAAAIAELRNVATQRLGGLAEAGVQPPVLAPFGGAQTLPMGANGGAPPGFGNAPA